MQNKILYTLLFCSSQAAAFSGEPTFAATTRGVQHTLQLSHWQVDRRGAPSFDFVYEQRKGACQFRMAGHADGVVDDAPGGKVELSVYNPEDARGREQPSVVMFDGDGAGFTLQYRDLKRDAPRKVGFMSKLQSGLRQRACDKGDDERLEVEFRK
jgi:hypothetical protein